jgi:hypothetical protein
MGSRFDVKGKPLNNKIKKTRGKEFIALKLLNLPDWGYYLICGNKFY